MNMLFKNIKKILISNNNFMHKKILPILALERLKLEFVISKDYNPIACKNPPIFEEFLYRSKE